MERSSQPPEVSRVARCPIILVHGTWGRGFFPKTQDEESPEDTPSEAGTVAASKGAKRWFEKGSEFRNKLEDQLAKPPLEYSIFPLHWSGANSVFARDRAAVQLADKLKTYLQDRSAAPLIIAHSHGGNVALRALWHLGDASRVSVVTMATPFLRVFARKAPKLDPLVWILLFAAVVLIVDVSALVFVALMLTLLGVKGPADTYVIIATMVAATVGSIFVLRWLYRVVVDPQSKSQSGGSVARDIQDSAFYPPVGPAGPRMLVIRSVDDEASLTLAAGSIGSRLSSYTLRIVIPGAYVFAILLLALLDWSGVWNDWADTQFLVVLYGCIFGALVCLLLPGMFKSGFGREFVTAAFVCETAADSAPDTSAEIDTVTLSPIHTGRRLRHYIYAHPKCVDVIVRWIRGDMENAGRDEKKST